MAYNMYICPDCRKVFKINGAGKKAKCPKCQKSILVDTCEIEEDWRKYSPEKRNSIIWDLLDGPEIEVIQEFEVASPTTTLTKEPATTEESQKSAGSPPPFLDHDGANTHDTYSKSTFNNSFFDNISSESEIPSSNSIHAPSDTVQNKKHSLLSIVSFILCIAGITSIIGLILVVVDLAKDKDDEQNHILSKISLGIVGFYCIIGAVFLIVSIVSIGKSKVDAQTSTAITNENTDESESPVTNEPTSTPDKVETENVDKENEISSTAENNTPKKRKNTDFRNTCWGDSIDLVKESEEGYPTEEDTDALMYEGDLNGHDVYILYYFKNDKLYHCAYALKEKFTNGGQYISVYEQWKENLIKKYGNVDKNSPGIVKYVDDNLIDLAGPARALQYGYTAYVDDWYTNKSHIRIGLLSSNYEMQLMLSFYDKNHDNSDDELEGF